MFKKRLTVVRGLPGSGKTTLAHRLMGEENSQYPEDVCVLVEADMFRYNNNGEYVFDPKENKAAHKACQSLVSFYLHHNILHVFVANTFVKRWEIEPYFKMAENAGAAFEVIEATGKYSNTHGVPEEAIERMRNNWEEWK